MPLFEEEQRFRQWWLWTLIGGGCLLVLWAESLTRSRLGAVILFLVFLLLFSLKLTVQVDASEIRIRFFPLARRAIPLGEVQSCEARTYRPIREYGGWGIKYGFHGMAYSVSGNRGVQLVLNNGKRILIGSQRADELAAVINAARPAAPRAS